MKIWISENRQYVSLTAGGRAVGIKYDAFDATKIDEGAIEMDERDRSIRLEALELAVRNPTTGSDTAETIVADAEKYFTFLKGEESDE